MVRKDVLRTDRHHPFFSGADDNSNVKSLFNILTTLVFFLADFFLVRVLCKSKSSNSYYFTDIL